MSATYTGNPANPGQGAISLTIPADGDADNAATFTPGYQAAADFAEMLYERFEAFVASSFWKLTSSIAASSTLRAISAAASSSFSQFITVGSNGAAPCAILASPDGLSWTTATAVGTSTTAFGVAVNSAGTLAVVIMNGASGQNVQTSPDTVTWTLRTSNITLGSQLGGVAYSPSLALWCIVGGVGGAAAVATSPDGVTWTARTLGAAADQMVSVCWAPSIALFIAVGYNTGTNAPEVYTSADGTTWTSRTVPTAGTSKAVAIAWSTTASQAMFVAANGSTWTSPDGINWTKKTTLPGTVAISIGGGPCLAHTGRSWLVIANTSGSSPYSIATSVDGGTTWKARRDGAIGSALAIGSNGTIVVVGNWAGTQGVVWLGLSPP